jgi:hypothetical protein
VARLVRGPTSFPRIGCTHLLTKLAVTTEISAGFQRIAECRLRARRFRSRIDHSDSGRRILCPCRNQSPLHQRKLTDGFFRMLPNDWDRLGQGNVVAATLVGFVGNAVELFLLAATWLLRLSGVQPDPILYESFCGHASANRTRVVAEHRQQTSH